MSMKQDSGRNEAMPILQRGNVSEERSAVVGIRIGNTKSFHFITFPLILFHLLNTRIIIQCTGIGFEKLFLHSYFELNILQNIIVPLWLHRHHHPKTIQDLYLRWQRKQSQSWIKNQPWLLLILMAEARHRERRLIGDGLETLRQRHCYSFYTAWISDA